MSKKCKAVLEGRDQNGPIPPQPCLLNEGHEGDHSGPTANWYNPSGDNPIADMMRGRGERIDSLTIADLIRESHQTAVEKGWWEKDRPFSEGIALIHSELSEALEEWRVNGMEKQLWFLPGDTKPLGMASELADVLIRVADWCGKHGIPLEEALKAKMEYNKTRPHRHGGKLA